MKVLNNTQIVEQICEFNGTYLYRTANPEIEIVSKTPLVVGSLYSALLVEEGMRGGPREGPKKFYRVVKINE